MIRKIRRGRAARKGERALFVDGAGAF